MIGCAGIFITLFIHAQRVAGLNQQPFKLGSSGFKQFLPFTQGLEGPKALIGDNLGCHFSPSVLKCCNSNSIRFVCLSPNTTHLCQPLDVAVFRPAKTEWKDILDTLRKESRCSDNLPKTIFPSLLDKLVKRLKSSNLVSGFLASGIWPLDRSNLQ